MNLSRSLLLLIAALMAILAAWFVLDAERLHGRVSGVFEEIEAGAVPVPMNAARPSPDGTIVYLTGEPTVSGPARGVEWPVVAERALRLDRVVQMFQWQERLEGSGDNKNLDYKGVWSSQAIDSRKFQHQVGNTNPTEWPFISLQSLAPDATIARHRLTRRAIEPILPTIDIIPDPSVRIASGDLQFRRQGDWFYHGDVERPLIGDIRIRWRAVPLQTVSLLGVVDNGSVVPAKDVGGRGVPLASLDSVSMADLLARARGDGAYELWKGRAVGLFVMLIAGMGLALGQTPKRAAGTGHDRERLGQIARTALSVAVIGTGLLVAAGWLLFRL